MQACNSLGVRYAMGVGVEKDLEKAIELYRKACRRGLARGCLSLKYAEGKQKKLRKAARRAKPTALDRWLVCVMPSAEGQKSGAALLDVPEVFSAHEFSTDETGARRAPPCSLRLAQKGSRPPYCWPASPCVPTCCR